MSEPKDIDELYYKYPQLFPKNCIECNVGWYEIIDHMCLAIQTYIDKELSDEVLSFLFLTYYYGQSLFY